MRNLYRAFISVSFLALFSTFAFAGGVHPLFDLQSPEQAPFPSDRVTVFDSGQNTGIRVNLPLPNCAARPSDCVDTALLNQLDGFNLQPRLSIPFNGMIDVNSVSSHTIFLVRLMDVLRPAESSPQVIGINQIVWDPATLTLHAESDEHLDQHTLYALIVTTGVRDATGDPIEPADEFTHLRHDLNFGQTKDLRLKDYRKALIRLLDEDFLAAISPGLAAKEIAVAALFTTESVTATLEKILGHLKGSAAPAADFKLGIQGEKTVFPANSVSGIAFQQQIGTPGKFSTVFAPTPALQVFPGSVGTIAFGRYLAPNYETAAGLIPAIPTRTGVPAVQRVESVYFNLFLPAGSKPPQGWPVAIFGHGFGDNKNNSPFAVASSLASRGIATISINAVGHGFGPSGTLTVLQGTRATILPAGGRGVDQNGDGNIDSTEGFFTAPPQNILAFRDGTQQTVADLMQLVRMIQGGVDAEGDGSRDLDQARIYYVGQSLGGIYGTVFLGIEPDVRAGAVNVPGGSIPELSRLSLNFRPLVGVFLASRLPSLINIGGLNFDENSPLRNLPPVINNVPGAMGIQTFLENSEWLQQGGDPVAWAPFIRKSPLQNEPIKPVILQFARGDETVPNPATTAIIRSGDLADRATLFRNDLAFALGVGFGKNPHAFLTNLTGSLPVAQTALAAQTQIAVFLQSDGTLTLDPDGAGPLFQTPILPPLPEDVAFIP